MKFKGFTWILITGAFTLLFIVAKGCKNAEPQLNYTAIKGTAGYPRFNLQFTGGAYNDVDLYVETPNGAIISYNNIAAQNGRMDIDCLCGDCPDGANENVFWQDGKAPRGTYKIWAEYFDPCMVEDGAAAYTIRMMKGKQVLNTFTGKLSSHNRKSVVYTFVY